MQRYLKLLLPLTAALTVAGCSNDTRSIEDVQDENRKNGVPQTSSRIVFSPANGLLPFPTDILMAGKPDGSINIPGKTSTGMTTAPSAAALADPQEALNTADGFSTISPITFSATAAANATSAAAGTGIHVFEYDRLAGSYDPATRTYVPDGITDDDATYLRQAARDTVDDVR